MAASPTPKKINGAEKKLRALRQECETQFLKDPKKLAAFRARALAEAKKSLLERKVFTESDIERIEAEEEAPTE